VRRLIAVVAGLVIASATIAQAATPEPVLNDPAVDEIRSSASEGHLVWSANSEARPGRYHSYVMADGGSPVRIDPAGGHSFGAAIDGTTVVYEQDVAGAPNDTDLWFYDVKTQQRSETPDGVNTPNDEYRPSMSGDWLLFTRTNVQRVGIRDAWRKIVLFDTSSGTGTVLSKRPFRTYYLASDQVNGDWATYESCRFARRGFFNCQVFRHQISAEETVEVANPGLQQYAGAVSDDGTVYLVRTRNRNRWNCGSHAKLVRVPLVGSDVVIAELPDTRDALTTFALDETGGSTTMYLDRLSCRNGRSGIYRIPDADTAAL
jgi:hypothetical protein